MSKNTSVQKRPNSGDIVVPLKERRSLQALKSSECRWPYGDPREKDFHFCGKPRMGIRPYCEFHVRQGFSQSTSRPIRPYLDV